MMWAELGANPEQGAMKPFGKCKCGKIANSYLEDAGESWSCYACCDKSHPAEGRKYDTSKPRMDLLPFDALEKVAAVLAFGAAKYGDNNWRLVEPVSRYEAAMLRHYAAHQRGEEIDPESGQSHLAHMATNALFILAKAKK